MKFSWINWLIGAGVLSIAMLITSLLYSVPGKEPTAWIFLWAISALSLIPQKRLGLLAVIILAGGFFSAGQYQAYRFEAERAGMWVEVPVKSLHAPTQVLENGVYVFPDSLRANPKIVTDMDEYDNLVDPVLGKGSGIILAEHHFFPVLGPGQDKDRGDSTRFWLDLEIEGTSRKYKELKGDMNMPGPWKAMFKPRTEWTDIGLKMAAMQYHIIPLEPVVLLAPGSPEKSLNGHFNALVRIWLYAHGFWAFLALIQSNMDFKGRKKGIERLSDDSET